jgi:hypothetical protein
MHEQPHDDQPRLPQIYDSPDKTVSEVAARASPEPEAVRQRAVPAVEKFGKVAKVAIDEALMQHALRVAEGDASRLVLRRDGSVIIANSRKQAARARKDLTFGAVELPSTTSGDVNDQQV